MGHPILKTRLQILLVFLALIVTPLSFAQVDANQTLETGEQEIPRLHPLPPNPFYLSQGFRLGYILRMGQKGLFFWRYRYEGQLSLGINTNQGEVYDNNCLALLFEELRRGRPHHRDRSRRNEPDYSVAEQPDISEAERAQCLIGYNPFTFSFFSHFYYNKYKGQKDIPVVIFYQTPLIAPQSILTDTKTYLRGIWQVDPKRPVPQSKTIPSSLLSSRVFTAQKGLVEGRIVGASLEDPVRETFEVILQLGEAGNNFRRLSVSDTDLFQYIVECMLTGKMLRIEYVRVLGAFVPLSALRGYETSYRIIGVSILE